MTQIKSVGPQGNEIVSWSQQIVDIMSLDDTVMSFRVKLSVLFSGSIPQDLFVDDRNGKKLKLQDRVSLREYGLLCFQLVTATFSSDVAPAFPEPGEGESCLPLPPPQNTSNDHATCFPVPIRTGTIDSAEIRACAGKSLSFRRSHACPFCLLKCVPRPFHFNHRLQDAV
jgi:hypothetical protein